MKPSLPYYLKHTANVFFLAILFSSCNPEEDLAEVLERWESYTTSEGLPDNFITAIFEDTEGRVWIGTSDGLAVYENNSFATYTSSDGLLDNNILAIASDIEGNIWVGNSGGVNIYFQGAWYYSNFMFGAPTTSIVRDQNGNIWMGTSGYGVVKFDWDLQQYQQSQDNVCDDCNYINVIYEDPTGTLWFGSYADLKKLTNNNWQAFTVGDGLPGYIITAIASDGWGNVWIGSYDGTTLSKFNNEIFQTIEIGNGSPQNWIMAIQEDKNGNVWFGTAAVGLLKYNGATFSRITDGLPGNTFTSLLADSKRNMLVGTYENGLIYYPIK